MRTLIINAARQCGENVPPDLTLNTLLSSCVSTITFLSNSDSENGIATGDINSAVVETS
jgi:16S rRNA U1498 N3-methylase RsmE